VVSTKLRKHQIHQDAPTLLEDLAASEQPKLRGMLGKHKLKNSQSHGLNTISFEESPSLSFAAVHFTAQICPAAFMAASSALVQLGKTRFSAWWFQR